MQTIIAQVLRVVCVATMRCLDATSEPCYDYAPMWKPIRALDRLDLAVAITASVLVVIIVGMILANHRQLPRLTYLESTDGILQNVYVVDTRTLASPRQITDSQNGVVGYGMTSDGSHLFYSEIGFSAGQRLGVTSFYEQDVSGGPARLLYTCEHSACTDLAVRPDGSMLAFQEVDLNGVAGVGQGAPRIWLLDTNSLSASPLFSDNQQLGQSPRWSPDGATLAVYSPSAGGFILHSFKTRADTLLRNMNGSLGTFSPDGRWLFYSHIVLLDSGHAVIHTVLIDLSAQPATTRSLETDTDPVSDVEVTWASDSASLLIARQEQPGDRSGGFSLYRLDVQSGAASELVPADGNAQSSLSVSPTGDLIAFERVSQSDALAHPGLWLYNLRSGTLTQIGQNLASPGWLS